LPGLTEEGFERWGLRHLEADVGGVVKHPDHCVLGESRFISRSRGPPEISCPKFPAFAGELPVRAMVLVPICCNPLRRAHVPTSARSRSVLSSPCPHSSDTLPWSLCSNSC
jgi:hypothetical protein